ncbi:glycine cleavage system protein H, partial [Xanthomonas citri pv. citri]|nr:glycine cleavage system protein H [Xanthomonas citri pv. citri]
YDKGWLFKMQLSKPEELDELMGEAEYETYVKTLET